MENKNIIITGATSFIAVELIKKLVQNNYNVYAIVRPNSININRIPRHENIQIIELDMRDIEQILNMNIPQVYACFHFAWEGIRGGDRNNIDLQYSNYMMSCSCISVLKELGINKFIGIGSQAEYEETEGIITETSKVFSDSEYGKMKIKTYEYGIQAALSSSMIFIWTRLFSVYGSNDYVQSLVKMCIHKMIQCETIKLSPCEHLWNYVYVSDVADLFLLLLEKCEYNAVYNVASDDTRKLKSFIYQIYNLIDSKSRLEFGAVPYKNNIIPYGMNPSIDKSKNELGWYPKTTFEEGIRKIIKEINYEKNKHFNTNL